MISSSWTLRNLLAALLLSTGALILLPELASAANIMVSPPSGSQDDTFTIDGQGLAPALTLDIGLRSPTGEVLTGTALKKFVVTDADGGFSFDVTPARDFGATVPGTWLVQVCVTGTDDCVQTEFDVAI